jgi:dTDP-glucose 4,6-dehydratase
MRVVLTGAAGFLGSHLADRLIREGHEVIGLDNFVTGDEANIAHLAETGKFRLIRQDVSTFIDIPENLDFVLHFAFPCQPEPGFPFRVPQPAIKP